MSVAKHSPESLHTFTRIFYGTILDKAKKCPYSPKKLTKPLNRLTQNEYSYDIVFMSLRIAHFRINIDSLIGS